jgi:DegV family protein with EDD domain
MRVALVTDSNAALPAVLAGRVLVVPLSVRVDGRELLEGIDVDADALAAALARGATVTTAAPAPGQFVRAYAEAVAAGAERVVSVHLGADTSGTAQAAALAARMAPLPVEVVDSASASFGTGCCVWAAAEALDAGGDADEAAAAARAVAARLANVVVLGGLALAERGGRLSPQAKELGDGLPVLALEGGRMQPVGTVHDVDEAIEVIVAHVATLASGASLRLGVGHAAVPLVADRLAAAAARLDVPGGVERFVFGPSTMAHTGLGAFGIVFHAL